MWPAPSRRITRIVSTKILAENVAKLYNFDLAALQPLADKFGPTVDELKVPLTELPENPNEALLRANSALKSSAA